MNKAGHNYHITHHFADGRVMTDEEFMSKPFRVSRDDNPEVYDAVMDIICPAYREMRLAREREEVRAEKYERYAAQEALIRERLGLTDSD